jgi:aspartate ammonia-lyase
MKPNSPRVRKEHDSLGNVEVPADALYGAQTARAVENYRISGRTAHPELIRAYLRLKAAAARVNQALGALSKEKAQLILRAVDGLMKTPEAELPALFPVDPYQAGAGTSQNMNANEVIANAANRLAGGSLGEYKPVHPNDHVNMSQSTNDSFPTAMRLALLDASRELYDELQGLASSFEKKARAWADIPKSGRTHLQDAVPMTLGQEFSAYAATLAKLARWLADARTELSVLGIGGTAAGTGLNAPQGYAAKMATELSRMTGEKLSSAPNLVEAMQSQSSVFYYSSMLRMMAIEMTRICNDLRLMASGPMTGLAELLLPAVQPGSSIMPGKVNPSIVEMANQAFFSVLGYDQSVAYCTQAGQLELNVMMPMMAYSLLEATHVATHTLATLRRKCIDGLQPNSERLEKYFHSTPQIATALSPTIGYETAAKLVQQALAEGKSVVDLAIERKLISEKELKKLLDVNQLTGRKVSPKKK